MLQDFSILGLPLSILIKNSDYAIVCNIANWTIVSADACNTQPAGSLLPKNDHLC